MIHIISGSNYHGAYTIKLRGPAQGFVLSEGQAAKVADTLCGVRDCLCGGNLRYDKRPKPGTARIVHSGGYDTAGREIWSLLPRWPRRTDKAMQAEEVIA